MSDTQSIDRSPTQSLLRDLYAMGEFLTTHAAVLPDAPWAMDASFMVANLDAFQALAKHFDARVYGDDPDKHRQFKVMVPGAAGYVRIFICWNAQ